MNSAASSSVAQKLVTVKIISDVVWPFCYIGLRHLEQASRQSGVAVHLEWRPFLLNPHNLPDEGQDLREHLVQKYGPSVGSSLDDPQSPLHQMGRQAGIEFNNARKMVNTQRAHALVEQLQRKGENDQANAFMVELYRCYFEEGQDINDPIWLTERVARYGLDPPEAAVCLSDANLAHIAQLDREMKHRYGVSGVPFFMIYPNNQTKKDGEDPRPVTFSGAYPPQVIAEQLKIAAAGGN